MKLEICANSYQSVLNAQNAGADRIELCSELSVGGVTPSYGLLEKVAKNSTIPIHVLVRPRSGNFSYSDEEFKQMKTDINICKELGFQGIVSGILKEDNTIDIDRNQELIALTKPLSFTFHRAFDCVPNPLESLYQLIDLQVDRILTSGQKNTAVEGLELLKKIKEKADNQLIILPASGINEQNILHFKEVGFTEVHASASKKINLNSPFFDTTNQTISDIDKIKKMLKKINNV